jgi:GNAT superfamily N-acetyltransferase
MTATYAEMQLDELGQFPTIDRSERIDGRYTVSDGILELKEFHLDLTGWRESETSVYLDRLQETRATGGTVFGAWDGDALAGLASLDIKPVGGNPAIVKLDLLHVSAPYRNKGIGKQLTAKVTEKARSLGATALYISATPSRNTIDAYLRMGARVLATPDSVLFAEEPEDIHLVLQIPESSLPVE